MAFTSAKMGLRIWNLLTDLYDHAQLADNWAKVDYHDHSPGKGVQVPTEGLADQAVTSAKLATALDPSDAYLSIKHVAAFGGFTPTAAAANTYLLRTNPDATAITTVPEKVRLTTFYFDPGWYGASGRTTNLQLRVSAYTNAVAPTSTYAFGLYPVTAYGGATSVEPFVNTIGTLVTGSTATITAPLVSTVTTATSEFAAPAIGHYVLAVVQTGAAAAGSIVTFTANVGVKQV